MGYELIGIVRRVDCKYWETYLCIARRYGWVPRGTVMVRQLMHQPRRTMWNGSYTSNDEQLVTCEDASALAEALGRAVADLKAQLARDEMTDPLDPDFRDIQGRHRGPTVIPPPTTSGYNQWSSENSVSELRYIIKGAEELIAFCLEGEFQIY